MTHLLFLISILLSLPAPTPQAGSKKSAGAQNGKGQKSEPDKDPGDANLGAVKAVQAFEAWLAEYEKGDIRFQSREGFQREQIERMEEVFEKLAALNDLGSARRLFKAATITPNSSEKFLLLDAQPSRPQRLARALIAGMTDPGIDAWLAGIIESKLPRKNDVSPARAAMEILSERNNGAAREILEKRLKAGAPEDRILAAMGLATSGNVGTAAQLLKLIKDPEVNLRLAVISSLSGILAPIYNETRADPEEMSQEARDLQEPVLKALGEAVAADKVWQVRAAARDALVHLRCREAIPLLIAGLKAEKGRAGEKAQPPALMARALHQALAMLTGQAVPEGRDDLWADFWAKEGATFRFAPEEKGRRGGRRSPPRGEGGYAKYFNLDIKSNRILFVVDFSGSMAEPIKLKGRYANMESEATTKYELVKQELEKVIRSLPETTSSNVIFFSTDVRVWESDKTGRPVLMKMNDRNKESLLTYVGKTTPAGGTNIYGALDLALQLAGRGTYDPYYEANFDTIYFLTDGMPSAGDVTDTREINRRVAETNKLRKVVINAISFGERNQMQFLGQLARDNGGEHIHVD